MITGEPSRAGGGPLAPRVLLVVAVLVVAAWVQAPLLELRFASDDFMWWLHARKALEDPPRLLAAWGGFRPSNTWLLAIDHALFGVAPRGYHATSLALHLACGALVFAALGRFALGPLGRAMVALLWLCAPWTLEPAAALCVRFEPIMLLCWLGLAWLWPGAGRAWTRHRSVGAVVLATLSMLTKESWIVLPGFVLAFEVCLRRVSLGRAVAVAAATAIGPVLYVGLYFLAPTIDRASYFAAGLSGALKVPHAWAVFAHLTPLRARELTFGLPEAVAVSMIGALAWLAWRRRSALAGVGFAFFLLPWLPILPVGFLVSRYTAIPYVGFLMIMSDAAVALVESAARGARQRLYRGVIAGIAGLVFAANLAWLRADQRDAERLHAAHDELLAEARRFLPELPRDRPVVAVRLEDRNRPRELNLELEGTFKLYYPRHRSPYALIDWPALWSFVLEPEGPLWEEVASLADPGHPFAVVAHREGGFVRLVPTAPTAGAEIELWQERGAHTALLNVWSP